MSPKCQEQTCLASELGGHGHVQDVALERVLGIELLVFGDERERVPEIAERVGHNRSGAVNPRFEGSELCARAAVASGLDHGIAGDGEPLPTRSWTMSFANRLTLLRYLSKGLGQSKLLNPL
jgi:hypothetical protein